MPCLLYCLTELDAATPPLTGIRGAVLEHADCSGLRCFYSLVDSLPGGPETLQRDALAFHSVTRALFDRSVIIPFRFPTTLESPARILEHLQAHAASYRDALRQFRDSVQMELRLSLAPSSHDTSGGTKYLRLRAQQARRLDQALAACRSAIPAAVIDWRQRESSHGVRCFALLRRDAVAGFQQQISGVQLQQGVTVSVSGPWPPTEFFPVFA